MLRYKYKKTWCWNQNCECGFKKLIKESTEIHTFECRLWRVCVRRAVIRDDGSEPWSRRFNLQAEIDQRISGWMGCHIRQRDRWHTERKMCFHTANEDLPNLNQEYCASLNAASQAERKMWLCCNVVYLLCCIFVVLFTFRDNAKLTLHRAWFFKVSPTWMCLPNYD